MSLGVTLKRGRLDSQEVDWTALRDWTGADDAPEFVGRYFLGTPAEEDLDEAVGFCLWAHGEGSSSDTWAHQPMKVVPLQRANRQRQEATGGVGALYGHEDATAFGVYLSTCLRMNDLRADEIFTYAFLEVDADTAISFDYWSSWCGTIRTFGVEHNWLEDDTRGHRTPFLPCIACDFEDDGTGVFQAVDSVKSCLDPEKVSPGRPRRCYGFWARCNIGSGVLGPAPDSITFEVYKQPRTSPLSLTTRRVPVLFWRWWHYDGSAAADARLPSDNDVVAQALKTLTLDTAVQTEGAVDRALFVGTWLSIDDPTLFGVDSKNWGDQLDLFNDEDNLAPAEVIATDLRNANAVVTRLPMHPDILELAEPLSGPVTLALRYYSTPDGSHSGKDLSQSEASILSRAGVGLVAVFQARVEFHDIPAHLRDPAKAAKDAAAAFGYAALIGQPAYTPIYFSIDTDVLTDEEVAAYFRVIRSGYVDYLKEHSTPYNIGIYSFRDRLQTVYDEGLASHFWQLGPNGWGTSSHIVWDHSNIWQVLFDTYPQSLWELNSEITDALGTSAADSGIDLNVSWGDPGSWLLR